MEGNAIRDEETWHSQRLAPKDRAQGGRPCQHLLVSIARPMRTALKKKAPSLPQRHVLKQLGRDDEAELAGAGGEVLPGFDVEGEGGDGGGG